MNKFIFFSSLFFVLFLSGCSTQINSNSTIIKNTTNLSIISNVTNSTIIQNKINSSDLKNITSNLKNDIQNYNKSKSKLKIITSNYSIVYLKLQPKQCQKTKWDIFWNNVPNHNVLDTKYITLSFKVAMYYTNIFNESSGKVTKVQINGTATCDTCGVCATSYYYKMAIFKMNENFFLAHGWSLLNKV